MATATPHDLFKGIIPGRMLLLGMVVFNGLGNEARLSDFFTTFTLCHDLNPQGDVFFRTDTFSGEKGVSG